MKVVKTLGVLGTLGLAVAACMLMSAFILHNYVYIHKPMTASVDSTVLVTSGDDRSTAWGTGVIFHNYDTCGNKKTFIWTCHHVVANNTAVHVVFDTKTNKKRLDLKITPVKVSAKLFNDEPREVGELALKANIIRFSDSDDLALLEVQSGYFNNSVHFPKNKRYTPSIGTRIYHVGCFGGPGGERSVSEGLNGLIGLDLDLDGRLYDRVGLSFQPGSSGGGVFDSNNGFCMGIIARRINGSNDNQGLLVPYRRMVKFAERLDCNWALNSGLRVPENYLDSMADDVWAIPPFVLKQLKD